jgi:phosphatidylserine/phosphatidylglycerophosphate/cardiolipin synthase-like enzyme
MTRVTSSMAPRIFETCPAFRTAATLVDAFQRTAARAVDVYYTPEEAAYEYEAMCIQEVIDARRADSAAYPQGTCPYRVRYMVYNLRNQEIVDKLLAAVDAGVDVQVLIEADRLKESWSKVAEWFETHGCRVVRSDRQGADASGAHLIGIDKRSLMHMKTRIFQWQSGGRERCRVLTGSLNPGGAPAHSDENLNVIHDPSVAARYLERYEQVRAGAPAQNTWDDDAAINVLFTPHQQGSLTPSAKLLEWIDAENELILLSVFQIQDLSTPGVEETLVDKLVRAKARGAYVLVLTDRRKSDGLDEHGNPVMMYGHRAQGDDSDERLAAAGIAVFELVNTTQATSAVHGKSALFGLAHMRYMTGEGNWTKSALGSRSKAPKNEESYVFVDERAGNSGYGARAYLANFLHLLRKYDRQFPESAETVIGALMQLPLWPRVMLNLGELALLHRGREAFAVCDHPAWPGPVRLDTSPLAGTPRFAHANLLEVPLGARFEVRVEVSA